MKLPKLVEVELYDRFLDETIVYVFPRRRQRDADLDEREKMLGNGRKMSAAERLSQLVENIQGLESHGLAPRGQDEEEAIWRLRVLTFFRNEDGQELAEDALLSRVSAIYPQSMFRGTSDTGLEVDTHGAQGGHSPVPLRTLREAGKEPGEGLPEVPADNIGEEPAGDRTE
jgi:hypothetical protein